MKSAAPRPAEGTPRPLPSERLNKAPTIGDWPQPPQQDPLRHRVSLYLARVVKALADFEDTLLKEDGFFARSDHFEAQVDTLRGEFEANERARSR